MRAYEGDKMWALFGKQAMPYDLDRDTTKIPSLEEMTRLAINKLNSSEEGFFLMVEGSKVNWAAHANDPVGVASEYLAFDFAHRDAQTAVIVLSDHGNSGLSIGKQSVQKYDELSSEDLFGQLCRFKKTAEGLANILKNTPANEIQSLMKDLCGFELNTEEHEAIYNCPDYNYSPIPKALPNHNEKFLYSGSLSSFVASLYVQHTPIGFTTHGHTGEDVILAVYHPESISPIGMIINYELNDYLCRLFDLKDELPKLIDSIFSSHKEVF